MVILKNRTIDDETGIPIDILVGSRSIHSQLLVDPLDNESKLFFVFTDLSIRIPGSFRFVINCIDLNE